MKAVAVIGKNYGDEGKGHAVAYFAEHYPENTLVVKHNGGAQAGHTVETEDCRFVFHQFGAGSFSNKATFLYKTFLFDPLKVQEEKEALSQCIETVPDLYVDTRCRITTVYDVLMNQYIEERRGRARHGSCGMGIWETVLRNQSKYLLTVNHLYNQSLPYVVAKLRKIRDEYCCERLRNKYHDDDFLSWRDGLFMDDVLLENAAYAIMTGINSVKVVTDIRSLLGKFDHFIFEGAQGLLLDGDGNEYNPYSTPSATGIKNVLDFHNEMGLSADQTHLEVCYVTRSYITRHGVGPLENECSKDNINESMEIGRASCRERV